MDKKEQTKLRVQRYRDKQKSVTPVTQSVTQTGDNVTQDVTQDDMLYPDGTRALLYPPSKFLEEDMKVQENVVNTMKTMSGSRLAQFKALGNTFTPNIVKNPELVVPT